MTRAGQALRQQWAQEARRAEIMANPVQRATWEAEETHRQQCNRVLDRYGRLLRAAYRRGELTAEQTLERWFHAQERMAGRFRRMVTR